VATLDGPPTLRNVGVPMRDGAVLAADVYLPADTGPWPVLLLHYPYSKDVWLGNSYSNYLAYFAEHGYAAAVVDFRGTGASEGLMPDAFRAIESADVYDVVEQLAEQPWCDGSVGVWGVSYGGIAALRAAAARPPHLRAVVAVEGSTDPYSCEVMRFGAPGLAMIVGEWATQMLCVNALPPTSGTPGGEPDRVWAEHLDALTPWHFAWRDHPTRDRYWEGREVSASDIECPTMIFTSWRDTNPRGAWEDFEALTGPRRIIAGPWLHGIPDEATTEPICSVHEMVRWFDRWLKDAESGIDREPPVSVYVLGAEQWESYERWPPHTRARTLYPSADGALRDAPDDGSKAMPVTFDATVGIHGGLGMRHAPPDQGGDDGGSTLFTTAPLDAPLDVVGEPVITLRIEFAEADTDVAARMLDVAADGSSTLIAKGYLRLSNPPDYTGRAIAPPSATVTVPCNPTRYRVAAGHRIRLALAGADFPEFWPVRLAADYSVIVGGDPAGASRVILNELLDTSVGSPSFQPPDPALRWRQLKPKESILQLNPPDEDGAASVVGGIDSSIVTVDGDRLDVSHRFEISTRSRRPEQTQLSTTSQFQLRQKHRTLVVDAVSHTASDVATATVSVAVDGDTIYEGTRRHRPTSC
jgi:uncharacterized protein